MLHSNGWRGPLSNTFILIFGTPGGRGLWGRGWGSLGPCRPGTLSPLGDRRKLKELALKAILSRIIFAIK